MMKTQVPLAKHISRPLLIGLSLAALALGGCSDGGADEGMGGAPGSGGSPDDDGNGGGTGGSPPTGGMGGDDGTGGQQQAEVCPEGPFGLPRAEFAETTEENPASASASDLALSFEVDGESVSVSLEGPVWSVSEAALFFSDKNPPWSDEADSWQEPGSGTIWKLEPGKTPTVHVLESGSNGLALGLDGNIVAATHSNRNLTRYDIAKPDTALGTVLDDPNADNNLNRFNSPNDLAVSSTGHIYFTDPWFQNSQDKESRPDTGAYWVDPDGKVTEFRGGNPNGISLSPDEKTLYVGLNHKVEKWNIGETGEPKDGTDFVPVTGKWSDGFAVDCAGNLYVTEYAEDTGGVVVWSPEGDLLGIIDVGGTATNAAFGGSDRKTLYVTRDKAVYSIDLDVPGYPY